MWVADRESPQKEWMLESWNQDEPSKNHVFEPRVLRFEMLAFVNGTLGSKHHTSCPSSHLVGRSASSHDEQISANPSNSTAAAQ